MHNRDYKATNVDQYPLKIKKVTAIKDSSLTRAVTQEKLVVKGNSIMSQNTLINDATRAWNLIPESLKHCNSILAAKKAIREFARTLPI